MFKGIYEEGNDELQDELNQMYLEEEREKEKEKVKGRDLRSDSILVYEFEVPHALAPEVKKVAPKPVKKKEDEEEKQLQALMNC